MTVVLACVKDTLAVGRQQSLTLEIKSDAEGSVTLVVPLGPGEAALMTREEFESTTIDCDPDILVHPTTIRDGAARLRLVGDGTVAAELSLVDFLATSAGTVVIRAVDHDDNTLATTNVKKATTTPRIERFEAEPYNLPRGGTVELQWEIRPDPAGDLELFVNTDKVNDPRLGKLSTQVLGNSDLTLSLRTRAGQEVSNRQLHIHAIDRTGFYGYQLSPSVSTGEIMGIHAGDGFLCVLLRENGPFASLWKTGNGFDAAFAAWQEERWQSGVSPSTPLRIPLAAARRPGVIFQNKLWLLGGDCCHPDRPLDRIGSYDFQADSGFRDDAAPWPARMGHAVVADDRHIWVLGGWRQGGGALNDIWRFNGKTWKRLPDPPWQRRCLFGAVATTTDVWIAGGFDTPGGKTYDDIWRYSAGKWEKIEKKLCEKDGPQYVAGSMFVLRDQPRVLTVYYDPDTTQYPVILHTLYKDGDKWNKDIVDVKRDLNDAFPRYDYFSLNTIVFSRAAFLWVATPNPDKPRPDCLVRYYMALESKS